MSYCYIYRARAARRVQKKQSDNEQRGTRRERWDANSVERRHRMCKPRISRMDTVGGRPAVMIFRLLPIGGVTMARR